MSNHDRAGGVVEKAYDWALWIIPKGGSSRGPTGSRSDRARLAASIELLMNLVDATYQARNAGSLAAAVREVNRIRYLVRLAEALRVINLAGHEFAAQAMDEVGRMAGGWLKSTRQRQLKGWEKPHRDCPRGGAGKGVKR